MSGKDKRCYQTRGTSRKTGRRIGKLQNKISEFNPFNDSICVETTIMDKRDQEDTLRSSMLRNLGDQAEKQRLVQELQMNSLELFQLSEKVWFDNR
jgi:hypothetical protein